MKVPNLHYIQLLSNELLSLTKELEKETDHDKTVLSLSKLTGVALVLSQEASLISMDFSAIVKETINKSQLQGALKERATDVLASVLSPSKKINN